MRPANQPTLTGMTFAIKMLDLGFKHFSLLPTLAFINPRSLFSFTELFNSFSAAEDPEFESQTRESFLNYIFRDFPQLLKANVSACLKTRKQCTFHTLPTSSFTPSSHTAQKPSLTPNHQSVCSFETLSQLIIFTQRWHS